MIVLGIILALLGCLLLSSVLYTKIQCRTRVEAVVSRVEQKKLPVRGGSKTLYTPVFSYTVDGKKYTVKADLTTKDAKRYGAGQKEFVFIDSRHPDIMGYGSTFGFFLTGLCLLAIGVAILVLCFL